MYSAFCVLSSIAILIAVTNYFRQLEVLRSCLACLAHCIHLCIYVLCMFLSKLNDDAHDNYDDDDDDDDDFLYIWTPFVRSIACCRRILFTSIQCIERIAIAVL